MLTLATLSIFGLIFLVPAVTKVARRSSGWWLALLPAAIAVYFATRIERVSDGDVFLESVEWVPTLGIELSFRLDGLSLLFSLLITGIGALVVVYAGGYLAGHQYLTRFYAYIFLFMGSMLGLVLADNIFTLFIFWELTSISSYLLIGFNHEDENARGNALQALLVTGGGGLALLGGLVMLGQAAGSGDLSGILASGDAVRDDDLYVPILLLVLAGAFTKSAQFPFHFWLPNAMVAPTPVSAYLHSATMVKAGIYLLMRLSPVLGGTDTWLYVVTIAGGITMVMGAFVAVLETDLKRVLAYSTLSVLGLLTMLLGEGSPDAAKAAAAFLLAHALYKGALFLVAGAVDHETGERDIRRLGGLAGKMPVTAGAAVLAAVSLAGLIPTFAFIAKETVLETATHSEHSSALLSAGVIVSAAFLVAVAGAIAIRPFFGEAVETPKAPHEAPASLWLGPALLAGTGLALGLAPGSVTGEVVGPAAEQIFGEPLEVDIALWHGFNTALLLSTVSIAAGAAIYLAIDRVREWSRALEPLSPFAAERGYEAGFGALNAVAILQTRVLQDGYLRHYMFSIVAVSGGFTAYTFLTRATIGSMGDWGDIRFHEAMIAGLIAVGAATAVTARSRLAAVAALGIVGYGIALVYVLFGAPDLAMTQVLVETLTVLLFVLVLYHLPREFTFSGTPSRIRDAIVAVSVGALVTGLILAANSHGGETPVSEFFAQNSKPEAFGSNVVNVILVDFRALDTLGEITVLALAGAGVYALLKLRPHREEDRE